MKTILEKKIETFLHVAQLPTNANLCQHLAQFFSQNQGQRKAVINGNLSLLEGDKLVEMIELPTRTDRTDAFLFDGHHIAVLNASGSDPKKKKEGGSSNNNNNNNNNNG